MTPVKRVVRNRGIDIAVFEQGNPEGETIVLVHGWPDTHHLRNGVTPHLTDRFRVVSYDTRGRGETTNPPDYRAFALAELAADFFAVVDAVSPDRPVHVLAHDWGSVQVWEAVCEPGAGRRIASFTSVSGPNLDHTGQWMRARLSRPGVRDLAQPLSQLLSSAYTFFFMTPGLPRAVFAALVTETRWKRALGLAEGTEPDDIHLGPTFSADLVNGLRIVNHRDIAVRPAIYDDSARWTGRLWRRDVNAGHWVPFSRPALLADATTQLIDSLAGRDTAPELRRAEVGRERREFDDHPVVVIGRETALAFARAGAAIVVSDIDPAAAEATAKLVAELGGRAHAYRLDVADESAVLAHADEVAARHGVPDVVVNNAGVGQAGRFLDTPGESFRRVLDINPFGVVNGSRAFAPKMVARGAGGHIVNLSSMAGYLPQQSFSAYSTSKAGVLMFSECLRAELAAAGIGVTAVCPGIVHTNIVATTY